jgi:hypothetical protein
VDTEIFHISAWWNGLVGDCNTQIVEEVFRFVLAGAG